jgi:hypothetical protein
MLQHRSVARALAAAGRLIRFSTYPSVALPHVLCPAADEPGSGRQTLMGIRTNDFPVSWVDPLGGTDESGCQEN